MKLEELFEDLSNRRYSKQEIAQAVRDIKDSPEFKAITDYANYSPLPRTEAQGTLMFKLKDGKEYGVYQDGAVRIYSYFGSGLEGKKSPTRLIKKIPKAEAPQYLIDVYKNRLSKLKVIIERYLKKKETVREFGFPYKIADGVSESEAAEVLEDLQRLFKFRGTVTIKPGKRVSYTGRAEPAGYFSLEKLPFNLESNEVYFYSWDGTGLVVKSLEGLPAKLNRLSLDYPPESWNHLPKFVGKNPKLTLKIRKNTPLLGLMLALQKNGRPFPEVDLRDPNLDWEEKEPIRAISSSITKNLPNGRLGILTVQKELIDLGMADNAKI